MGGITSFRAREFYQWMLFVDGENLTMCAQRLATVKGFALREGPHYLKDVHLWLPGAKAFMPITSGRIDLASRSLRCLYYTSVQGDDAKREGVRKNLWGMGFEPIVHKRREGKSKAVDIRLTTDILSNAYLDNYDVCVLATGDGDYIPVVDAVKRRGKLVLLWFFKEEGLNTDLLTACDDFTDFWPLLANNGLAPMRSE